MTSKEEYLKVAIETELPIFYQPWWLDTVYGQENWDGIVIDDRQEIRAIMPYSLKQKMGVKLLMMPFYTPYQGPLLFQNSTGKRHKRYFEEERILHEIVESMPRFSRFQLNFHPSITNGLPFYWKGFTINLGYTYILNEIKNKDTLFSGFRSNIKRNIRKAEKNLKLEINNPEALFQAFEWTYARQSKRVPGLDIMKEIVVTSVERGVGKVFSAYDKSENLHASVFIVWDNQSAYYLIGGSHPTYRKSGAMPFLMWRAICSVSHLVNSFDFEGSMVQPIEHFFKGFGAERVPYLRLQKYNNILIRLKHCLYK